MLGDLKVLKGQTGRTAGIQMDQSTCRELLLMAFIMSLQVTLWRSFIIREMIVC